jgi:hypothetical protein
MRMGEIRADRHCWLGEGEFSRSPT